MANENNNGLKEFPSHARFTANGGVVGEKFAMLGVSKGSERSSTMNLSLAHDIFIECFRSKFGVFNLVLASQCLSSMYNAHSSSIDSHANFFFPKSS